MDEYVFVVKGSGRIYLSDRSINPFRSFTSKWVTSSPLPKGYMCQFEASSDEDGLQFVAYADVEDAHLALAPIFLAMQPPPYQEYIDSTSNIEGTTFPSCTSGTTPCRPAGPFFAQTLQPIEPATDVLSSHRPARVRASFEPSRTESLFKICTETQAVNAKYTSAPFHSKAASCTAEEANGSCCCQFDGASYLFHTMQPINTESVPDHGVRHGETSQCHNDWTDAFAPWRGSIGGYVTKGKSWVQFLTGFQL
jgi:hypothetical protein